jgi:hypothetical protein
MFAFEKSKKCWPCSTTGVECIGGDMILSHGFWHNDSNALSVDDGPASEMDGVAVHHQRGE